MPVYFNKNDEIYHNTNPWKFQLLLLSLLQGNSKSAFRIFVSILMAEFGPKQIVLLNSQKVK